MKRILNTLSTPMRVAIFGSLIVAVILILFLGASYQRQRARTSLQENMGAMRENLDTLREVDRQRMQSLQEELEEAREDVAALRESFPQVGAPFAIYRQSYQFASQNDLDLISISLSGRDNLSTPTGSLLARNYTLTLEGPVGACVLFLNNLEQAGQGTLIIDNINITPPEETCVLDVQTYAGQ